MSSTASRALPPDQAAREQALDSARSVLVQAPAGSGKTDLLARRFLRLLGEVEEPGQVVAITFTNAAAAEMRHRILSELEKAATHRGAEAAELSEFSIEALARRALVHSEALSWNLIALPSQLRITTIDAFCRELALQQPLLSGLGGGLDIYADPQELYRRAARRTLEQIDSADRELRGAIEMLLAWRDNGWQEMEDLLVKMLEQRDRWMRDFVLGSEQDWEALRERLERPFARAVRGKMEELSALLAQVPRACEEALELARFACELSAGALHRELAELAEFPAAPFLSVEQIEEARRACEYLAALLLTKDGGFRQRIDKSLGFPADRKAEKARLTALIADLSQISGLEEALAAVGELPPARYTEDEWLIVRACFALLRRAAAELKVVFAEQGAVDYTEVAQIALHVLKGNADGPGDAAMAVADGIRHLLVDEFQDTSRRQHELLRRLIAAWPEREGRTCFVVGDPMQSIYFFRDADAELFPRVRDNGLEIDGEEPLAFDPVALTANFRTAHGLVDELNQAFEKVFAADDGSGVAFTAADAARREETDGGLSVVVHEPPRLNLHLHFMPRRPGWGSSGAAASEEKERISQEREAAHSAQMEEMVALIQSHAVRMEAARAEGKKYRIAVLGRARTALAPIAAALREKGIPFAAIDLEKLNERPEILDALALARALLNSHDRVAWLGVLRAPWCGLSLDDVHALASADDPELQAGPMPKLIAEREHMLSSQGRVAAQRVRNAAEYAAALSAARPEQTLGTWVEQVWLRLGGSECVDAAAHANLALLWKCMDELPEGEQGVLGPPLGAALEKLTALPDPEAESDCGVRLMTIHKAKGLEFEVVIVPELQAGAGRPGKTLLSWMERGLAEPDNSSEIAEFLVAPIPPKGADRGLAKIWVDRMRREREAQEARRLLYVAATRAREELHQFARPEYKTEKGGAIALIDPKDGLLATAWPAIEKDVREQFERWSASGASAMLERIAAAEESNLLAMHGAAKPTILRRLPADYEIAHSAGEGAAAVPIDFGSRSDRLYRRHEGGLFSRALGVAVHAFMQELAKLRAAQGWQETHNALADSEARITAQVRVAGIEPAQARRIAAQALEIAMKASREKLGQWILSPHPEAASEVRWAGVISGGVHAVQVDRVFLAGAQPLSEGNHVWWIVDYKTAHADGLDAEKALPELRELFAPQLDAYARVLRNLHGADARVCAGLYYPRMLQFDWWEM